MADTPTKYRLIRGTYEQLGYTFLLEKDGRGDWSWEVRQPHVNGSCQEMSQGCARTKTRAMKASIVALRFLDDS